MRSGCNHEAPGSFGMVRMTLQHMTENDPGGSLQAASTVTLMLHRGCRHGGVRFVCQGMLCHAQRLAQCDLQLNHVHSDVTGANVSSRDS